MPAPARISVPVKQSTPVKSASSMTPKSPTSIPRPKARVVHRRRARGRLDDTDTDDEPVREPHSDSDSDSPPSTLDSESISDSEPEDESNPDARVPSPSRTPLINSELTSSSPHSPFKASVFPQHHDWSEMVAEENAHGAAALPVIDFADLSSQAQAIFPQPTASSPPSLASDQVLTSQDASVADPSSAATRKPGQSVRQAYLTRLDNDPAYVPTLGQFWSHDDRLLDKNLRPLSGWWRGRWQTRGRGTRGRGGFAAGWGIRGTQGRGGFVHGNRSSLSDDLTEEDAPLVDRAWTHDGFEELKKADEAKRPQYPFRGRVGFLRGRGVFRGGFPGRGGSVTTARSSSPQARPQSESQHSLTSDTLRFGNGTRPWFAMKPERVWTKQFDSYLYFEAQLKPVHHRGLGQGVRIKLPRNNAVIENTEGNDNEAVVVRLPQRNTMPLRPVRSTTTDPLPDRTIVVKLPVSKRLGKEDEVSTPEDVITVAAPPMEDPLLPIHPAPTSSYRSHPAQEISSSISSRPAIFSARRTSDTIASLPKVPMSTIVPPNQPAKLPQLQRNAFDNSLVSDESSSAGPSQSHTHTSQQEGIEVVLPPQSQPPVPPPLQTLGPSFQPSPPYDSPYGYATPGLPLPPGIAVSETGVTYEIATGRAVYLHTPPPPPPPPQMQVPMYTPRPMPMHHPHHGSVHFLPPHHTTSMSMSVSPPAFLSSPPNFALPRQNSRIEIRAPGEGKGKEREAELIRPNSRGRSVGSRLAVNVNAEPFTPASHAQPQALGYYMAEAQQQQAFDEAQRHHHQHQQSMSYQPASYYYPVGPDGNAQYGYGQQYSNVDAGQSHQYDTYGQELYPQQPTVYY